MRMSRCFSRTLREAPGAAETLGYQMLLRAGYVKQLGQGIFDMLPFGLRSIRKIENIVREEMNGIGGQEVLMPLVNPAEIWKRTGRYYTIGSEMTRLKDRNEKDLVLAMTHEEAVTELALAEIDSYKKLPQMVYQIQTKWRDDPRPRAGLIRVREFTMKDAYSFDKDMAGLEKQYKAQYDAYFRIFARIGLPCIAVKSDSGMMGGKVAHEYMYLSGMGEDTIIVCPKCGYTANKQVASFDKGKAPKEKEEKLEKIHTPDVKTIDDLSAFLKADAKRMAKAVFMTGTYEDGDGKECERLITAIIRGDLEVEENKLQNAAKAMRMRPATEEEIRRCGMEPGFGSPIGAKGDFIAIVDDSVSDGSNFVAGANEKDFHFKNANFGRDFTGTVADIAGAKEGCKCPECGKELTASRGVEIGNIFQLGTKYSDSFSLYFQDEKGEKKPVVMGCYGIGIGRALGCLAEEYSDEKGLRLPISVAPFDVTLVSLLKDSAPCDAIYGALCAAGLEVLYDDRDDNAGVKFCDAELIGNPIIVTLGNKGLKSGCAEVSLRDNLDHKESVPIDKIPETVSILRKQLFKKVADSAKCRG